MSFQINTTNEFICEHPNAIEKKYTTVLGEYLILYEDVRITETSDSALENYHSVILENPSRNLLSFAPPKTLDYSDISTFLQSSEFADLPPTDIHTSELIEGTFIHLFYDRRIESWEIATKKAIGGRYSYYHVPDEYTPNYREMMMEAFHLSEKTPISEISFLADLSKTHCYSWILQHPKNHIVIPIETPKMYLVSVFEIQDIEQTATFISPEIYQAWSVFEKPIQEKIMYFPKTFTSSDYLDENMSKRILKYIQENASIHTPYYHMGLVFTNINTGKRATFINPNYLEMAEIRGNHSNLLYQYLCLKRIQKIQIFLHYFPQYYSLFNLYKQKYDDIICKIHGYYLSYYVKKSGEVIPKKFFSIIYKLHHLIFLPSISTDEKIIIRKSIVREYLQELDPITLLSLLNSNLLEE
jgi:hypothetical protein